MADSYTTSLRLRKQVTNTNLNVWGDYLNDNVIEMLDDAVAGVATISLASGDATLTTNNGTSDQSRAAVLYISGTGGVARTVTIPSVEKLYRVRNGGTSTVLFKTASGTGVSVLQGTSADIYCDGTECYRTGVSGWGKLSSTTFTATSMVIFSTAVTGQKFSDAKLVVKGAVATTATVELSLSGAGGDTPSVTAGTGLTNPYGSIIIPNYCADAGHVDACLRTHATDATLSATTDARASWRMAGGITAIRLHIPSGSWGGGGTGEVWLR